jgi:hypothetical protein
MAPWCVLRRGDTIFIYYGGMSHSHATGSPGAIGLATLPADRFVSFHPLYSGRQRKTGTKGDANARSLEATLETRALQAPAGRLLVNAAVGAEGTLQVEALDAGGAPLAGFAASDCELRRHDDLRYEVRWGGRTLDNLRARGAAFRLRFRMLGDVNLYAIQVAAEPAAIGRITQ